MDADSKKKLEIYYAPFEYGNTQAKVVIVGITPGMHQMRKSFSAVVDAKEQMDAEEVLRQVKNQSSFEGPMRKNLVNMLDELGLHEHLGIATTMNLFDKESHLVHTTSVLPYPVFKDGKNYSGSSPQILKTPLLKQYVTECFATEFNQFDKALIIPLGVKVAAVLDDLANEYSLHDSHCILTGFPHPSGANGKRKEHFEQHKAHMKEMIRTHFENQSGHR